MSMSLRVIKVSIAGLALASTMGLCLSNSLAYADSSEQSVDPSTATDSTEGQDIQLGNLLIERSNDMQKVAANDSSITFTLLNGAAIAARVVPQDETATPATVTPQQKDPYAALCDGSPLSTLDYENGDIAFTVSFYLNDEKGDVYAYAPVPLAKGSDETELLEVIIPVEGFNESLPYVDVLFKSIKPAQTDKSLILGALGSLSDAQQAEDDAIPPFDDNLILGDFDSGPVHIPGPLSDMPFVSPEGYSITSVNILSEVDSKAGDIPLKSVSFEIVYENGFARVTESREYTFRFESGQWVSVSTSQKGMTAEAISGIDDTQITSNATLILDYIDENCPVQDKDGNAVSMHDLYVQCKECTVTSNLTAREGGSATLHLVSDVSIGQCEADITVNFAWAEEGGWVITGCTLSKDAGKVTFQNLIGTWTGEWTEEKHESGQACFYGKANPFVIDIKSVDDVSQTIRADICFAVHDHILLDNAADYVAPFETSYDTYSGDVICTYTDVLIPLYVKMNDTNVYSAYEAAQTNADIEIAFSATSTPGVLKVEVKSAVRLWAGAERFSDVYYIDFHKSESIEETPVEAGTTSDAAATDASQLLDEVAVESA